jgi:predicted Zn-dependent protease with MMP-like domain
VLGIRSVTVQADQKNSGAERRRVRRRDRHGRGLRGRLVPTDVPLYRSRAQQFDDLVLDAVARLEPRWETELSGIEFAVQEVPDEEIQGEDLVPVPLARIDPGEADPRVQGGAHSPRIVLYRRPLLARAEDEEELSELIFDVVVEEVAELLGLDPDAIDPGYADGT